MTSESEDCFGKFYSITNLDNFDGELGDDAYRFELPDNDGPHGRYESGT